MSNQANVHDRSATCSPFTFLDIIQNSGHYTQNSSKSTLPACILDNWTIKAAKQMFKKSDSPLSLNEIIENSGQSTKDSSKLFILVHAYWMTVPQKQQNKCTSQDHHLPCFTALNKIQKSDQPTQESPKSILPVHLLDYWNMKIQA